MTCGQVWPLAARNARAHSVKSRAFICAGLCGCAARHVRNPHGLTSSSSSANGWDAFCALHANQIVPSPATTRECAQCVCVCAPNWRARAIIIAKLSVCLSGAHAKCGRKKSTCAREHTINWTDGVCGRLHIFGAAPQNTKSKRVPRVCVSMVFLCVLSGILVRSVILISIRNEKRAFIKWSNRQVIDRSMVYFYF